MDQSPLTLITRIKEGLLLEQETLFLRRSDNSIQYLLSVYDIQVANIQAMYTTKMVQKSFSFREKLLHWR